MSNPVTLADLEGRFRPLSDDEQVIAESLLVDAWAIATVQAPGLAPAMATGSADRDVIVAVLAAMAIRVLRNPDGVRQWSVDDYSETRDGTISAGALYLSEDELSLLGLAIGAKPRRAFSVGPDGSGHRRRYGGWLNDPYRYAPYGEYDGYGYILGRH